MAREYRDGATKGTPVTFAHVMLTEWLPFVRSFHSTASQLLSPTGARLEQTAVLLATNVLASCRGIVHNMTIRVKTSSRIFH